VAADTDCNYALEYRVGNTADEKSDLKSRSGSLVGKIAGNSVSRVRVGDTGYTAAHNCHDPHKTSAAVTVDIDHSREKAAKVDVAAADDD